LNNKLFISINNNYNKTLNMKIEQRLYGCGCKGGKKNVAETTTTTTTTTTQAATTATVPTVQPTSN
jgi:hypothetical protein